MMRRALALAEKGLTTTTPNPRVGCVVVRDGQVIGEGWHEKAGGPHAEAVALENIDARGATVYLTLEPCNHHGRTPPCPDLPLEKRVKRLVAAMGHPNPGARGRRERLHPAGLRLHVGL